MVGKITSDKKITGSVAATLLNANPYSTRNELLVKILAARGVEGYSAPEFKAGEAADWGNTIEPFIISEAAARLNIKKFDDEITDVYSYENLFEVSLDGILYNDSKITLRPTNNIIFPQGQEQIVLEGNGIIEAKLTGAAKKETPPEFRGFWQVMMGMLCTEMKWAVVATLYKGTELVLYVYQRDSECFKSLIEAGNDFYSRLDGPDWYPAFDGYDAASIYENGEDDLPSIDLKPIEDSAADYYQAKTTIKSLEKMVKELEPIIMDQMGNHTHAFLKDSDNNIVFEVKWPMRRTKAQPEKVVPAKPEKYERQKSLSFSVPK